MSVSSPSKAAKPASDLSILLAMSPSEMMEGTGNPLLDTLVRDRSYDDIMFVGDDANTIFEFAPYIAKEILAAPAAEQGDIFARIAVAIQLSGPEPHISNHIFRDNGYHAERLFCMASEIAKQDTMALSSVDAAIVLDFICDPDGDCTRDTHWHGSPSTCGLNPDWEATSFTWWLTAILGAVARNGEASLTSDLDTLLDRLTKKWDALGDETGGVIIAAQRMIAELHGEAVSSPAALKSDGYAEARKGFRDQVLAIATGHDAIHAAIDAITLNPGDDQIEWESASVRDHHGYRYGWEEYVAHKTYGPRLLETTVAIKAETDTKQRGKAIATIHRLTDLLDSTYDVRPNLMRNRIPEINAIEEFSLIVFELHRKPATFSEADAIAVLRCKPDPRTPALFRNIARALTPETVGAREMLDAFTASLHPNLLTKKDARKSIEYLEQALGLEDEDDPVPDTMAHAEELARELALFVPKDGEGYERWANAAEAGLGPDKFKELYELGKCVVAPVPSMPADDVPLAVYRLALPVADVIAGCLAADLFALAKTGTPAPGALDTLRQFSTAAAAFKAIYRPRRVLFGSYHLPDLHPVVERRVGFYITAKKAVHETFISVESFCATAPKGSKPSAGWIKKAAKEISIKDRKIIIENLDAYLKSIDPGTPQRVTDYDTAANAPLIGLIWLMADLPAEIAAKPLTDLALRCFTSIPGIGIKAEKAGNACLWTLQQFTDGAGAPYLARIAARVKYPKVKKKIDAALNAAAEAAGMTRTDLDELLVPDHGFAEGERRFETGHGSALLTLTPNGALDLAWLNAEGNPVKTPTAAMKANASDTIKEVKALAKEALADLSVQLQRIERLPLEKRAIPAAGFVERYLEQPLIGTACRALIWQVGDRSGLWQDGALRDLSGDPIPLEGKVSLWHPVEHASETVIAWRDRLEEIDLVQPIKQAWREVYLVTDAERATGTYSNRFAGHILKQHQTMTLARMNGWHCTHRMAVDAPNDDPTWIAFPAFGVHAELWTGQQDVESPTLDSGAFVYIHTDRTTFFRHRHGKRASPMEAAKVPPIVFSEVMRHCDLFVSVASISTDPEWIDRGAHAPHPSGWEREADTYWHGSGNWDLTGSAQIRREALERIVPRLKIAKQLSLSAKHLRVQGVKGAYRIHLGSAAVHREADDRHVCIVSKGRDLNRTAAIKLPFDGDRTLSLILSKAMLLAADDKITDKVILDQI